MTEPASWRTPVALALVAGLALRLYLIFATPVAGPGVVAQLSSYNDEIAHVNYIDHVRQTGTLPEQVQSIQGDSALYRGQFENYQPPLYYVAVARLAGLFGISGTDQLTLAGRLLNLPLFAGLLLIIMAIGREIAIAPGHLNGALIILSLNGIAVRFTATASNDTLFWLFAGAMIWSAARMWHAETAGRQMFVFGLLAIAGLYTKASTLLLIPLPVIALFRSVRVGRVAGLLLMYGMIAIVTGPVWTRNVAEFGSWLPLHAGFGRPEYALPPWESLLYAVRSFVFPWSEFWAGMIGLLLMLPVLLLMLVSVIRPAVRRLMREQPVLPAALIVAFLGFVWLNVQYRQAEARYLFAAWPSIIMVVAHPVGETDRSLWLLLLALLLPYGLFLIPSLGI